MGIKDLNKFLREKNEAIFQTIHLSTYRYKKIAVDANLYMYKFGGRHGTETKLWLQSFIELISCLRENDIHPIFVFDNPEVIKQKAKVREKRQKLKDESIEKLVILQEAMERCNSTGEIDTILLEFQERKKIPSTSLLRPGRINFNEREVQNAIDMMKKQIIHFDPEDYKLVKDLFTLLGIPFVQAPEEGEKLMADLCLQKKVETVLTDDSDIVVYGTPTSLSNIDVFRSTVTSINYTDILEVLEFTPSQFTDFCIMCGCDPNDQTRIRGYGPAKSYKLLKSFENIETIRDECKLDVSALEHEMCRDYFTEHKKVKIEIPYCSIPNFAVLKEFMDEFGLKYSLDRLKKNTIAAVETEEEEEEIEEEEN